MSWSGRKFLVVGSAICFIAAILLLAMRSERSSDSPATGVDLLSVNKGRDQDLFLARARRAFARRQSMAMVDWDGQDIQTEEEQVKEKLQKIEAFYEIQPQVDKQLKSSMDMVRAYLGERGVWRSVMQSDLLDARARLHQAEEAVMRKFDLKNQIRMLTRIKDEALDMRDRNNARDKEQDEALIRLQKLGKSIPPVLRSQAFDERDRNVRALMRDTNKLNVVLSKQGESYRAFIKATLKKYSKSLQTRGKEVERDLFAPQDGQTSFWSRIAHNLSETAEQGVNYKLRMWYEVVVEVSSLIAKAEDEIGRLQPMLSEWKDASFISILSLNTSFADLIQGVESSISVIHKGNQKNLEDVMKLRKRLNELLEKIAVGLQPCLGTEMVSQGLRAMLAILVAKNASLAEVDGKTAEKLHNSSSMFLTIQSKLLAKQGKLNDLEAVYHYEAMKNLSVSEAAKLAAKHYQESEQRNEESKKDIIDERELILYILKLLSQNQLRQASASTGRLLEMERRIDSLEPTLREGRGERAEQLELHIRDTEEIKEVKGILLELLLRLNEQLELLDHQLGIIEKLRDESEALAVELQARLLTSSEAMRNVSSRISLLSSIVSDARSQFKFRSSESHALQAAIEEQLVLNEEEEQVVRLALQQNEEKLQVCLKEHKVDAIPQALKGNKQAESVWERLIRRLTMSNSSSLVMKEAERSAGEGGGGERGGGEVDLRARPCAGQTGAEGDGGKLILSLPGIRRSSDLLNQHDMSSNAELDRKLQKSRRRALRLRQSLSEMTGRRGARATDCWQIVWCTDMAGRPVEAEDEMDSWMLVYN
eukprot:765283-Hanusia_phi.AAC.2